MLKAWLASDLGQRLGMSVVTQQAGNHDPAALLKEQKADAVLAALPHTSVLPPAWARIDTGHVLAPMAIMRSDSSARDWAQLKARVICLARDSRYAGMPAQQHGGLERHFDSVAEALLALRTGECEAAVHDDLVLDVCSSCLNGKSTPPDCRQQLRSPWCCFCRKNPALSTGSPRPQNNGQRPRAMTLH